MTIAFRAWLPTPVVEHCVGLLPSYLNLLLSPGIPRGIWPGEDVHTGRKLSPVRLSGAEEAEASQILLLWERQAIPNLSSAEGQACSTPLDSQFLAALLEKRLSDATS